MGAFILWKPKAGPSKSLFFDACTSEGQSFTSTATEHPVETGANVSDHVRKELDRVTIEVFVSNAPIYDWNDRGGKLSKVKLKVEKYKAPFAPTPGAVFAAVGGAVKGAMAALLGGGDEEYAAQVLKWDASFDAVADTLQALEKIKNEVQLVDVVLPSRLHENMMLESIEVERNPGHGDAASFKLGFKQIRQVEAKLVNAPKSTQKRGEIAKKKGAKGATEVKPAGRGKSILKSLKNHL